MKMLFVLVFIISFVFGAELRRDSLRKVVIDIDNQIMWQDSEDVVKINKKHKNAVEHCLNLNFGGYSNWRLPSVEEYKLIVDKKNTVNYIKRVFKHNLPDGYWAEDTLWRTFNFYAYYMNFISGTPYYYNRDYPKYVRCVRDIR